MAGSIDLVARKVLCLSLLYYGLDVSLVPDTEFDHMCQRLHDEWDDLSPHRQWQLEPREDIRASGFHVKVSERTARAALNWADSLKLSPYGGIWHTKPWNVTKHNLEHPDDPDREHSYEWLLPADFVWNTTLKAPHGPRPKAGRSPKGAKRRS